MFGDSPEEFSHRDFREPALEDLCDRERAFFANALGQRPNDPVPAGPLKAGIPDLVEEKLGNRLAMLGFGLLAYPRFKQRPHNQLDLSGECLLIKEPQQAALRGDRLSRWELCCGNAKPGEGRSEEHTSELQSLMRLSYAVFCLKNKK